MIAGMCRQCEVECRTLAQGTGCPDSAAVLRHDGAADRESEACSAHQAGVRGVDLLEAVEDDFELVRGDAAALVADFDDSLAGGRIARAEDNFGGRRT